MNEINVIISMTKKQQETIVGNLKKEMIRRSISVYRLNQITGVSRQAITEMMKEPKRPALYTILMLMNGLDMTLEQLFRK